jgi:hypothetical protein
MEKMGIMGPFNERTVLSIFRTVAILPIEYHKVYIVLKN